MAEGRRGVAGREKGRLTELSVRRTGILLVSLMDRTPSPGLHSAVYRGGKLYIVGWGVSIFQPKKHAKI